MGLQRLLEILVMRTPLFGLCDNSEDIVQDFNHKDIVSKWNLLKLVDASHLSFITHAFHSSLLHNTDTFIDKRGCLYVYLGSFVYACRDLV